MHGRASEECTVVDVAGAILRIDFLDRRHVKANPPDIDLQRSIARDRFQGRSTIARRRS